ncbi:MAG TPA: glutathione S-transferase family protein [Nevskiaceae bacterium]|nr:glutathione S-transferase family protein [Nevskiaceae bacterium]
MTAPPSSTEPVIIIGSLLSPYVRKVLAVLNLKGLAYRVDPIVPFLGDERFTAVSPLRRIPVLIDDRVTLADSSVICQYLEDRYPGPPVYPADVADRARARWLEEFADTRMGDVFIWRIFNQVAIGPHIFGRETDRAALEKTVRDELPPILDYLEALAPPDGFAFGPLSIADIGVAAFFRNLAFSRVQLDEGRWRRTAAWVARTLAHPCLASLAPLEEALLKTPRSQHREALARMGVSLTADTWGTETPRPGIMRID